MLTISGQTLGKKKPLFSDWSVPLPPGADRGESGMTLRDVIAHIVRSEVAAFKQRQQERQTFRALTERQITEGLAKGKVESGGSEVPVQEVDPEQAIATALQAFEDGLYLVVLDGDEQKSLDGPVHLQADSRITFIRLTLLAGG